MLGLIRSSPSLRRRLRSWLNALAAIDVFPDFSAMVRRLFYNPLGVLLAAALAALLCGLFLHPQGFVLCGGVLAVVVLGVAWPWLSLRWLSGVISFDRKRATEGDKVEVRLKLRNRLPWAIWGLSVRDGFARSAKANEPVPPAATIASAPRRCSASCRWTFAPPCRGVYPFVPPSLATGFPFGLWENKRQATVETRLLVWPGTFPVGPMPGVSGAQQIEGNVSRNKAGSNGDVLGVRPYRRGDSPRRIHWRQTARHDRIIVCELQSNARPTVQLILDADPNVHIGDGGNSSREWAIRIVASLAKGWLEEGAMVGGVWSDQAIGPSSGPKQLLRLLDSLAQLANTAGPTLPEALDLPACVGFRDGLQVVVTTDAALARLGTRASAVEQRLWVILRAEAFRGASDRGPLPAMSLPLRPWLWIDDVGRIPTLLRGGWKEAQHGS